MANAKGLGKGLSALFGEEQASDAGAGSLYIKLNKIEPMPNQPRKVFDDSALSELSDSIIQHGVITPLVLRKMPHGQYQIIAGERRWRAARMAGLDEVPANVIDADDKRAMVLALIENLQREDLNPVEEAESLKALIDDYGFTQDEVASRVGRSRPAVTNSLRLLSLPDDVLSMVSDGRLTSGHARAVLALDGEARQREAAASIAKDSLSVRQAEQLAKRMSAAKTKKTPNSVSLNYLEEHEHALAEKLNRKVRIISGRSRGRIELEFYGADDFEELIKRLL